MKAFELTAKAYQGLPIQRVSAIDRAYSIHTIPCFKFEWHDSILCLKALGIFLGWQPLGSYLDTLWLMKNPYGITVMRSQPGPRLAPPPIFCRDFESYRSYLCNKWGECDAGNLLTCALYKLSLGPRKARRIEGKIMKGMEEGWKDGARIEILSLAQKMTGSKTSHQSPPCFS